MLYSNTRGLQKLSVTKDGYIRHHHTGSKHYFDKAGKMIKVIDKNGYFVDLNYSKDANLASIKDSKAKQIFFSWYPFGKVKCVWSGNGAKKSCYEYEGKDLVASTDVGGNKYKYKYDKNHNLSEIAYSDNTKMQIKYHKRFPFAEKVVARDNTVTTYKYESNPKNKDLHYWTTVNQKSPTGVERKKYYEYEIKVRPDGSRYTYRMVTELSGLRTETVYSECCSLPIKISRGKDVTNFEYNSKGLLTKKTSTKGDFVQLDYHKSFNKITRVLNNDGWTNFDYDKRGNLSKAVGSTGQSVLLLYDREGRITRMIDHNKKTKAKKSLSFKYNSMGKPIEISMDKVGVIRVAYDNYGSIKKVDSDSGTKMALQVTQAFQSLLSIVRPAGVNLRM